MVCLLRRDVRLYFFNLMDAQHLVLFVFWIVVLLFVDKVLVVLVIFPDKVFFLRIVWTDRQLNGALNQLVL